MSRHPLIPPTGRGRKQTEQRAAVIASRRQQVADLWVRGRMSVRQIADQLGISVGTITADKKAIVEEWREEAAGAYQEFVLREWKSLDALERKVQGWLLGADDHDERCKLVDRLVKIGESRRKLLGLDAPEKLRLLDGKEAGGAEGVIVDLEGLAALIPGPDDRDGYEAEAEK